MADFREHYSTAVATSASVSYDPKPTLQYTSKVGLQSAMVGLVVSATQNALGNHNRGATGIFTRTGGTIGIFGECNLTGMRSGHLGTQLLPSHL
jgi:hypothetical protein